MRVSRAQARLACGRFDLLQISRPLKCTDRKMRRMNCSELRDLVAKYSADRRGGGLAADAPIGAGSLPAAASDATS